MWKGVAFLYSLCYNGNMKRHNFRKIITRTIPVLAIGIGVALGSLPQSTPANAAVISQSVKAQRCQNTTVMGHRGTSARGVKENSLAAFRLAAAQGIKTLEFDIHRTKDGQWVVNHDATIKGHKISKTTYKQLKKYNSQLATYRQVMQFISTQPGVKAMPEIKPSKVKKGSLKYIARVINDYNMKGRTEIQSFHRSVLQNWSKYNKGYRLAFIENKVKYSPKTIRKFAHSLIVRKDLIYNGKVSVASAHSAGLRVYAYTANSTSDWNRLIEKDVNGVLTDYAGDFKRWCDKLQPIPTPAPAPVPTPSPAPAPVDPPTPTDPVDPADPSDPVDPDAPVTVED